MSKDYTKQPYCKKPCHDCPFRANIVPYQSGADVARNAIVLIQLEGGQVALCHHTDPCRNMQRPGYEENKSKELLCGGFLAMTTALGLRKDLPKIVSKDVYQNLQDFILHSQCHNQSRRDRTLCWLANQPTIFQDRYILKIADEIIHK